jgi:hypothetical protein
VTDLFDEVEEQLRSDRYRQLAQKALPWVLGIAGLALAAALAYWGWDSYRTQAVSKASEQYAEAMDAFTSGDRGKARVIWTDVSKSQAPAYKALALMHLGAYAQQERKPAEAARLFDEAAEAAPDLVIGDAARLKSAFALLDTAPLKDLEGRLKPMMEEGRPYRVQAREALGFAKLNAGDSAGARGEFVLLSQSLDAPEGARARAQAAIALIDAGSAKAVPAVVRTAVALPPPMPPPSAPTAPGQPQPQATGPQ